MVHSIAALELISGQKSLLRTVDANSTLVNTRRFRIFIRNSLIANQFAYMCNKSGVSILVFIESILCFLVRGVKEQEQM